MSKTCILRSGFPFFPFPSSVASLLNVGRVSIYSYKNSKWEATCLSTKLTICDDFVRIGEADEHRYLKTQKDPHTPVFPGAWGSSILGPIQSFPAANMF